MLEIAPEIAAENGLAAPGDEIELHVVAERASNPCRWSLRRECPKASIASCDDC